jgi:phosphate transport system protein
MTSPGHPHLEQRIRHDLDTIRRRLRRMCELVVDSLEDAVAAVAGRDRKLAYQVVLRDNQVDALDRQIERLCQEFLIRHMPAGEQLRFIISVIKVNSEVERIGDYAEAIARRAVTLSTHSQLPETERILEMSKLSLQALRQAVQAFIDGDPDQATGVFDLDRQVDAMNSALFQALAHPQSSESDLTVRFVLLGVMNRLERVADRACNVAEEAIYVARGEVARHPRREFRVLFFAEHNHCHSQMAEAIARKAAPASFVFTSAGSDPASALDPGAVSFMSKKGIDISRQRPKGLADVGPLEDFNVVVALSAQAEQFFLPLPYGVLELTWETADPSKVTGTAAEREAAYEATYRELKQKIDELIEGLLGVQAEKEEDS